MMSVSVMASVVDVLVYRNFDGVRLGDRHRDVFFDSNRVGFFDRIRHGFFNGNGNRFVNRYSNRMRNGNVDGVRLRHGYWYWMRHVNGDRMRDGNADVFDDGYPDWSLDLNMLGNGHCLLLGFPSAVASGCPVAGFRRAARRIAVTHDSPFVVIMEIALLRLAAGQRHQRYCYNCKLKNEVSKWK